jgi:hypothetical protein
MARPLFTVASILIFALGLGWFLAPGPNLTMLGFTDDDASVHMARRYAVLMLGFGMVFWSARSPRPLAARRGIVWTAAVVSALLAGVSLHGVLSDTVTAMGWIPVVVETVLTLGFGYVLLFEREPTS